MTDQEKKDPNLKQHLTSEEVKDKVKEDISKLDEKIQSGIKEITGLAKASEGKPDTPSLLPEEIKDISNLQAYQDAIKHLDKTYHQFEHNFFPNVNKYPSSLIDEKTATDNLPESAHAELKTIFDPRYRKDESMEGLINSESATATAESNNTNKKHNEIPKIDENSTQTTKQ